MMRINTREQRLLAGTLLVGLLAILQIALVRPAWRDIRRLSAKGRIAAQQLEQMRSVVARRSKAQGAYEAIQSRITSGKTAEREIIDILLSVEKAAREAGVEILENSHVKDDPAQYFDLHTVRFRGSGEATNMMRMIYALQDPQLLLKIPQMDFSIKNYKLEMELEITRVVYTEGKNG